MSTSEQQQQPQPQPQNIICIENECDTDEYELNTSDKSPIDLQNQPELPLSCRRWNYTYTAYHISKRLVVIEITATNTLVKIEHHWRSKPLHVHIIEHLCPVYDIYGNEFDEVCGHTIFVIFTDHMLRIDLENEISGSLSSFKECKTDFSFNISEPESSSFRIIEDERNERLRACLVSDELCWKKVELFDVCLFRDDECLFGKMKENFFRLPPNITEIEISLEDGYVILTMKLISQRGLLDFPIYIDFRVNNGPDSIFLLNNLERCILATSDQLNRFQQIGFESVATISVCQWEDHDEFPEIQAFIEELLKLNEYPRSREDSDYGSDSD
jgi:hypothetical protein